MKTLKVPKFTPKAIRQRVFNELLGDSFDLVARFDAEVMQKVNLEARNSKNSWARDVEAKKVIEIAKKFDILVEIDPEAK